MDRIKIVLDPSVQGNLKYYIYRSETELAMPTTVEELQNLSPIAIVDEAITNIFYDYSTVQPGVEYFGTTPSGLCKPAVEVKERNILLNNTIKIPYLRIVPTTLRYSKGYYYNVVGVDVNGNVTKPSGVYHAEYGHNTLNIKLKLEYSSDYNEDSLTATWTLVKDELVSSDVIEVGNCYSPNYSTFSQIATYDIPMFSESDVVRIRVDNKMNIKIPNVWNANKPFYKTRKQKSYRLASYIDTMVSEYTVMPQEEMIDINTEKMILLKKDVSDDVNPTYPLELEQDGVEVLKMWIRKDGLYYDFLLHNSLPSNVITSDSSVITMDEDALFYTHIVEDNILAGRVYNYTILLYDSYKNKSNPVTFYVE